MNINSKKQKLVVGRLEDIVRNAILQYFLLFAQCCQNKSHFPQLGKCYFLIIHLFINSCHNVLYILHCRKSVHRYWYLLCSVNVWHELHNFHDNSLTHSHTITPFEAPGKQAFWKHCGKRRNCSLRAISPFPMVFSTCLDNFHFSSNLKLSSANSFSLEESKICHLVMG